MLQDESGRRYIVPPGQGSVRVKGLGVIDAATLAETPSGSRVKIAGKEFLLLEPTLSDMLLSLERGPQVILEKDASLIVHYLDIHCDSTVLELGAGSGALTLHLLQAVGKGGSVITLDNRPAHLRLARRNIERFDLDGAWHPVAGDGRRCVGSLFADAVCVDIPDPWNALASCWDALKPGGMLASYSPTVNQTEHTVTDARGLHFMHEMSFEVILRRMDVAQGATRHSSVGPGHTGYISVFRKAHRDK